MTKYVDVQVPILTGSAATGPVSADGGTTDGAVSGKLTDSTQNFETTVAVGDYVFISTAVGSFPVRSFSIVTAVDSNTALSISGAANSGVTGLSASGTIYFILAAADIYDCDKSYHLVYKLLECLTLF